jgi:hypothetical protein
MEVSRKYSKGRAGNGRLKACGEIMYNICEIKEKKRGLNPRSCWQCALYKGPTFLTPQTA